MAYDDMIFVNSMPAFCIFYVKLNDSYRIDVVIFVGINHYIQCYVCHG